MAGARHVGAICVLALHLALVGSDNVNFPTQKPYNSTVGGVWPKPQKQYVEDQYVGILDSFSFKITGKSCDILEDAVSRHTALLKTNWRHLTRYDLVNMAPNIIGSMKKLKINLVNDCEKYPHLEMDEKYTLEIKEGSSLLQADSIWGILRGLETFCQLPAPAPNAKQLIIQVQKIEDFPKYPHRGLLIDTSRHYLSLKTIKKQIDILSYNKMNVLHWHIVDDQSFPYQSKKFPSLSEKGAFGPDAVYTEANIKDVVEHARLRGVRVVPEFDTPGHTDSFEPGMSQVHCHCPHPYAGKEKFVGPFDPTKNSTYDFVRDLFAEVHERFPDTYMHLGGDEVDYYCWDNNPEIKRFMSSKNWDSKKLQSYYMQNILQDTRQMSMKAIVWEEVYNNWRPFSANSSFDKDTIVQLWRSRDIKGVAGQGFKVIFSEAWYLDNLSTDFESFYAENLRSITNQLTEEEHKSFLGGEACMWGEKVDDTNLEPRVWPRTSAVAEHLWSGAQEQDSSNSFRITEHICRLRRRDVQVSTAHSISYCADTLPRPSLGFTGRFFSMTGIRHSLGLDDSDADDEVKYETVNNSTQIEKLSITGETPSADSPVEDKKDADSGASTTGESSHFSLKYTLLKDVPKALEFIEIIGAKVLYIIKHLF